jgi:hypothetical protein
MVIKELRLAIVQVESITDPLVALRAPEIPYPILLSDALFEAELGKALAGGSELGLTLPWAQRVGKRFWFYYLNKTPLKSRKANQLWRNLVPLRRSLESVAVSGKSIPGTVETYAHLYPWGIGLIADVHLTGSWSLDEAVNLALKVRREKTFEWTADGMTTPTSAEGLLARALAEHRSAAYGIVAEGQRSDVFSIVTVIDASDVDATTAVKDKGDVHRALDGWTGWSPLWKSTPLRALQELKIEISTTESLEGHMLYGGRRGRVVWFPAKFRSVNTTRPDALVHYHQNLFVSTLQTESLCRLSQDAADRLTSGETLSSFSGTYRSCVTLAAGILGRLWGRPDFYGSYRSDSVRDQIKRTYFDAVNTVRTKVPDVPMDPLKSTGS